MENETGGGTRDSGDYALPNLLEESFSAGDIIIREGDMGVMAYKIISGSVEVKKQCDDHHPCPIRALAGRPEQKKGF